MHSQSSLSYRAPYLFAILLRKCGVGPELITILAEPTRQAICGLSIAARQRQPEYVVSFLVTLREIMLGAAEAAGLIFDATHVDM